MSSHFCAPASAPYPASTITTSCSAHAISTETSEGMPIDTLANGPPCTYTGEPLTVSVLAGLTASPRMSVMRHRSMNSPNVTALPSLVPAIIFATRSAISSIDRESTTICMSSHVGVSTTFSCTSFLPASTTIERSERDGTSETRGTSTSSSSPSSTAFSANETSRFCAASIAPISPHRPQSMSSGWVSDALPPPDAPPFDPAAVMPMLGWRSTAAASIPRALSASMSAMVVVVLPSPRDALSGVSAVTSTTLPCLRGASG